MLIEVPGKLDLIGALNQVSFYQMMHYFICADLRPRMQIGQNVKAYENASEAAKRYLTSQMQVDLAKSGLHCSSFFQ